ncbi:hypothetical protein DPMN_184296 [Dreissena polymorpha]|uniref:Uncharacterized protein n=1 Tax=Dreissena polymorpha TaxID=45954 RepID=A0A9D4I784_DREPO|nr:hypothetical protein DPMN_184296 [Dreissena polymorpha]
MRHPAKGGGDAVQFTSSQEMLASTMEGRPVVQGITWGIDSDGNHLLFKMKLINVQ